MSAAPGDWTADDSRAALATVSPRAQCILLHEAPSLDPYTIGDSGESWGIAQIHRRGLVNVFRRYVSDNWTDTEPDEFNPYQAARFLQWALDHGLERNWTPVLRNLC